MLERKGHSKPTASDIMTCNQKLQTSAMVARIKHHEDLPLPSQ
jgi:hypothetical protein